MHPCVLREQADVIAEPLSIIFERSWRTAEVPEDQRIANVVQVFKKDKKEDPGNYRPVSLISVPGKIREQILFETMQRHLKIRELICDRQHDLSKGKLCLTNLVAFYNGVTASVDKGRLTDAVCLDSVRPLTQCNSLSHTGTGSPVK